MKLLNLRRSSLLIAMMVMLGITATCHGEDDLPTLESLETRPSMEQPQLSLPHDLVTVPVVKPGEYHVPPDIDDIPYLLYGMSSISGGTFLLTPRNTPAALRAMA